MFNLVQFANSYLNSNMGLYEALEGLASLLIIFGGVIPYIPQYLDIRSSRNSDGFSTYVCLTLLVANTLRILFWFGHPFEMPLLIQSVIMNVAMLAMVYVCITVRQKSDVSKLRQFSDFIVEDFWQWTDFASYVQFITLFAVIAGCITAVLNGFSVYVEALGLCSVLSEALLGMPQFYRNHQNQSTEGMSVKMVLMWMCGDLYKTTYFVLRSAPMQFWLCGGLQVGLDIAILLQVMYYGANTKSSSSSSAHRRMSPPSFTGVLTK